MSKIHPLGAALTLGVALLAHGAGTGEFTSGDTLSVGDRPIWVAVGDFDEDTNVDIAVANCLSRTISILYGRGNGSFEEPIDVPAGFCPGSVVVSDFNRDQHDDLAIANADPAVLVLLGDGTGGFSQPDVYPVAEARTIATGDFNSDGEVDLAVTGPVSPDPRDLTIFLGDANGQFPIVTAIDTGGNVPSGIAVARLDEDPHQDLVISNTNGFDVTLLFGDGAGGFPVRATLSSIHSPSSVGVGRFNDDAHVDLAVTNRSLDQVSVLFGDGTGGFSQPFTFPTGDAPSRLLVWDLNDDGNLDFAISSTIGDDVSVLLGDGFGGFSSPMSYSVGSGALSIAAADFDGDGAVDLAVANFNDDSVSLLRGVPIPDSDGDGVADRDDNCPSVANPEQEDADEDRVGDACDCGDVNGDGVMDLLDIVLGFRANRGLPPFKALEAKCEIPPGGDCAGELVVLMRQQLVGVLELHAPEACPIALPLVSGAPALVSTASGSGVVAPGSRATLIGRELSELTAVAAPVVSAGELPIMLGGIQVSFDGVAVGLLSVAPDRVDLLVPADAETRAVQVQIRGSDDSLRATATATIAPIAPGIFIEGTTDGEILGVVNAETLSPSPFAVQTPQNPGADKRTRLAVTLTGLQNATLGATSASLIHPDGRRTGLEAEALDEIADKPGLDRVVVVLPPSLEGAGRVRLTVSASGVESNSAEIVVSGSPGPSISDVSPRSAPPGTRVSISGTGFVPGEGPAGSRTRIRLNPSFGIPVRLNPISVTPTELTLVLPPIVTLDGVTWYEGPVQICVEADAQSFCDTQTVQVEAAADPGGQPGELLIAHSLELLDTSVAALTAAGFAALALELQSDVEEDLDLLRALIEDALAGRPRMVETVDLQGQQQSVPFDLDAVSQILAIESLLVAQLANEALLSSARPGEEARSSAHGICLTAAEEQLMADALKLRDITRRHNAVLTRALGSVVGAAFIGCALTIEAGCVPGALLAVELTLPLAILSYANVAGTIVLVEEAILDAAPNRLAMLDVTPAQLEIDVAASRNFDVRGTFIQRDPGVPVEKALRGLIINRVFSAFSGHIASLPLFERVLSKLASAVAEGTLNQLVDRNFLDRLGDEIRGPKVGEISLGQDSVAAPEDHSEVALHLRCVTDSDATAIEETFGAYRAFTFSPISDDTFLIDEGARGTGRLNATLDVCAGQSCPGDPGLCGDGQREAPEECDDGGIVLEPCSYGETTCVVCDSTCALVAGTTSFCGDGQTDGANGEECDDGNLSPGDGCSEVCHEEGPCAHDLCVEGPPLSATCDACVAQICAGDPVCCSSIWDEFCVTGVFDDCGSDQCIAPPECGNGVVEGIESCDDGNTLGGDGCSAVCQLEINPSPLACSAPLCLDVQVVTGDIVQIRWNGTSIAQSAGASLFNLEFFVGGGQVWQLQISFEFPTSLPSFPQVFGGVPEDFCFRMTATATTPSDDILAEARSGNAFPCF